MTHRSFCAMGLVSLVLCAGAMAQAQSFEQNWPAWRGPLANGVAPAADPPLTWSEMQNVKWKVKLPGTGQSTPIVWGNQVFVQTAVPTGRQGQPAAAPAQPAPGGRGRGGLSTARPNQVYKFVLLCLDRATGNVLWERVACEQTPHEGHHRTEGSFAAGSPVTDGQHVYAFFGSRGLYCYDLAGNLKWSKDFGDMRIVMSFGEGSSPALAGDRIIVNWDHEGEDFIAALDKTTGQPLWQVPRDESSTWATPFIVEHDGRQQIIVPASGKIRSYDPESGKVIWECAGLTRNVIPCPVAADGVVYATSGYRGNALLAIRLGRTGDLTGTDAILYTYRKGTPYVPSPLLYEGRLYFFSGNTSTLTCLEARTGKVLIDSHRIDALDGVYASPVAAAGRIYLTGRNGTVVVIKPSDTFEVLATNSLGERFDASPVLVGNEILLRGPEHLYCISSK